MREWWGNLSVIKKLYAVVGLMAILIASELFTLLFAMATLSSVRAFVAGEGLWIKSQKDAVHSLYRYSILGDERLFQDFKRDLRVTDGDHLARTELFKSNFDRDVVRVGFLQGGNHPSDIDGMVNLLVRFNKISFIHDAILAWTRADERLVELRATADELHAVIRRAGASDPRVREILNRLADINVDLEKQEMLFSSSLGAGSRWLEHLLMTILAITVFTVESTGLFLTYRFSRMLSRTLGELTGTAAAVGRGDFSQMAQVRSRDELGRLAEAINKMTSGLRVSKEAEQQMQDTLRQSEERSRLLIESVSDYSIYMLDPEGRISSWNSGAEKLKGYQAGEVIGKHVSKFYQEIDRREGLPQCELEAASLTGRFERDVELVRKDGSTFWANILVTPLRDRDGKLNGYVKVTRDITERRQSDERLLRLNQELEMRVKKRTFELAQRERQLRLVTDSLPVLVAQISAAGEVQLANEAFKNWCHRPDAVGLNIKEVIGHERYERISSYVARAVKGESVTFERDSTRNGRAVNFQISCVPEITEHGEISGFIMVASDITRQKETQRELELAKETAEVANATKSAFLANMSHEIRTPLGALLGFSDLLSDPALTPAERAQSVEIIQRNGELLSNLINDILDLSKVEAGKLEIEKIDVDLAGVLGELRSVLGLKASERNINLSFEITGPAPERITTDPLRLKQILLNILGNALKFTEQGAVRMHVQMTEKLLQFVVSDTGSGIPQAQQAKLFAPFAQADASTTRKFGGTGLGLVLSRKLARKLGGDVRLLRSTAGEGSTFEVSIDPGVVSVRQAHALTSESRPASTAAVKADPQVVDLRGVRVLVVDDSPDNQKLALQYLRKTGALVETASNGLEAVGKALGGEFAVILMDLQMPVMDGAEALKELRRLGYRKPVIALTAHAMKDDRTRSLAVGFDDYVSKPMSRDALWSALARHTQTEFSDVIH